jgi:hypothetical protein
MTTKKKGLRTSSRRQVTQQGQAGRRHCPEQDEGAGEAAQTYLMVRRPACWREAEALAAVRGG